MNKNTTSPKIALLASKILTNPQSSETARTLAASALSQLLKRRKAVIGLSI